MGKKVKKKARSGQKEKRSSPSPKTVSQQVKIRADTNEDGVAVLKDKTLCSHIDKGINLEKLSAKLGSSESRNCEDCRENLIDRGAKKGKDKHGKKGGINSKSESKAIWICLECGHFSCGGVGLPTTPHTHAVRHAKQNHHRLVVHYENHQLVWCFSCNKLISAEKSDDNKHKEVLNEVVKMLKAQPEEGSTVDVEDVWFGSGSVTSAVNSDYSIKTSADGRAGYSVRGLVNLGNTCFFNSIMQNLLAINSLRDYFIKLDDSVGPLSASMRKLFQETSNGADSRGAINPRSLFGSLCTKSPQFRGYQQHDSHELLRCLLDGLSSEESSVKKHTQSSVVDPTFVDTIFGGQLSSTVSCLECGHSSTIHEPFLDLSLPVPTKKPPARRAQPVTCGKKPKLPPKRSGRNFSKISRNANSRLNASASEQSTGGSSSSEVQSIAQPENQLALFSGDSALSDSINPNLDMGLMDEDLVAIQKPQNQEAVARPEEQLVLFSGDYTFSDSFDPNTVALDMGFTDEDLSAIQKPQNQQAVGNSDSFAWLDYLDPDPVSHDIEMSSENDEIVNQSFANEGVLPEDVSLSIVLHSSIEDKLANAVSATSLDNTKDFIAVDQGVLTQEQNAFPQGVLPEDVSLSIALHSSIEDNLANAVSATSLDNTKDFIAVDQGVLAQEQNAFPQVEGKQDVKVQIDENPSPEGSFSKAVVQFDAGIDHCSDSCSQACSKDSNTSGRENENPSQVQDSRVMLPLNKEDEASSVEVPRAETKMHRDEKDSLDFEGFGDLFNEPEVSLTETAVTKNGGTVNSSESDPDEVDNADAPVSVESCLAFFTKPELLTKDEHAWQCDNCSKILREQRNKSRRISQMPTSEIVPNGCEDRNPSGLQTSNKVFKDTNGNLEKDSTKISDVSSATQKQEIYENGEHLPGNHPETETNVIEFQSECSSSQNLDHRRLEECGSDKNGLAETDLFNAECESDACTQEDVNSENLKVKRDARKSILISKAPSILTIHLKRFSQDARGRLSKLNGHVNFRETIDLKPYMDPRSTNGDTFTYRLVGVVEHLGTMRGGHYVAYVRGTKDYGDSIWYHASDAYVREAPLEEVLQCEAYILFYEGT